MDKKIFCTITMGYLVCSAQISLGAQSNLTLKEQLGKFMYTDVNFSFNQTQSCQTCHAPDAGFADPSGDFVSLGADGSSVGDRNAPTSAYAGYSPILHLNAAKGEYVGGMFWDGRATGEILGDPLAEQAQGPPVNPVEMGMKDYIAVVEVVRNADYADLFEKVYGKNSLVDDPTTDADEVAVYDQIGAAIAAYERSTEIQKFTSKYDMGTLNSKELRGFDLYKTHCRVCHTKQHKIQGTNKTVAVFTSYSYANIGTPENPEVVVANPPDIGLGATTDDPDQNGKFKIPTLRNVAVTAPYSHNGVFPDLKSIVEFKNSRLAMDVTPEVTENISPLIGDMGMSDAEIDDLIAFLEALTDL